MSKQNKKYNEKCQQGIVALFPAIILSSILLILCVGISQSFLALLYRTTIFDEKTQSDMTAESCVFRVLAKHAQDPNYFGGDQLSIGDNFCYINIFSTSTFSVSVKIGDAVSIKNASF